MKVEHDNSREGSAPAPGDGGKGDAGAGSYDGLNRPRVGIAPPRQGAPGVANVGQFYGGAPYFGGGVASIGSAVVNLISSIAKDELTSVR